MPQETFLDYPIRFFAENVVYQIERKLESELIVSRVGPHTRKCSKF